MLTHAYANTIQKILEKIPIQDQEDIERLFYDILIDDSAVYTLFGDKPISLSGDFTLTPWENIVEGMKCGGRFWKRWKTWEKYANLFSSKKYLIIKNPGIDYSWAKAEEIFVINKAAFIQSVEEHLVLFERILEKKIHPIDLLNDIEKGRSSLRKSINNNKILLGILLGFGKHNCFLFVKSERDFGFTISQVLDAQLKPVRVKLTKFDTIAYPLMVPRSIICGADHHHPETKMLQKKYRCLRGKISSIYSQGNFLEITLSRLISDFDK